MDGNETQGGTGSAGSDGGGGGSSGGGTPPSDPGAGQGPKYEVSPIMGTSEIRKSVDEPRRQGIDLGDIKRG